MSQPVPERSLREKCIARLFEGDVEAGVMQTATFDRSVSEGIYVYVLRWNGQMITGKVIITR